MNIGNPPQSVAIPSADTSAIPSTQTVVAVVIEWRGKIALLKRSRDVHNDRGLWHCITGYLEPGASPKQQALQELIEETGLHAATLLDLRAGPDLVIISKDATPWLVHTFTAVTSQRRLKIDWEHDAYRWITPNKVKRFVNRVAWLDDVLHAALLTP
ncbi:NUDIX domain-containing protein [Pseudarthrobacter sp. S9]|uniref:NUDIX domain-containing protein n=1 Tax=Pseudarthrobacter sp. S9 TaxID=3418421 RepID=UPI003D05B57C